MTANELMNLIHEYGRVEFELGRHGVSGFSLVDKSKLEAKSGEIRDTISIELDRWEREKRT